MSNIISVIATGPGFSNALQLADVVHDWTVYLVDASGGTGLGVILPANTDVGDVVEFHPTGGSISIYPDSGSTFDGTSQPNTPNSTANGYLIRKTTATTWQTIANR